MASIWFFIRTPVKPWTSVPSPRHEIRIGSDKIITCAGQWSSPNWRRNLFQQLYRAVRHGLNSQKLLVAYPLFQYHLHSFAHLFSDCSPYLYLDGQHVPTVSHSHE